MSHNFFDELSKSKEELSYRYSSFETIFKSLLEKKDKDFFILETGVLRVVEKGNRKLWGDGQSTYLFDQFVNTYGGQVVTVDINPKACEVARSVVSEKTRVICGDSVQTLDYLAQCDDLPSIDLLYLDSFDADWNAPHLSSLHHIKELSCVYNKLSDGALILVDDSLYFDGRLGKGLYVADFLANLGAELIHQGYQYAWRVKKNSSKFNETVNSLIQNKAEFIDVFKLVNPVSSYPKLIHDFSCPPFVPSEGTSIEKGGKIRAGNGMILKTVPLSLREGNYEVSFQVEKAEKLKFVVHDNVEGREIITKNIDNSVQKISIRIVKDTAVEFRFYQEGSGSDFIIKSFEFERNFIYKVIDESNETLERSFLRLLRLIPPKNVKKLLVSFLSPTFLFNAFFKSLTRKKKYKKDLQVKLN